jgi:hypothetical protein
MTGGTSGFEAIAAERVTRSGSTRLILGAPNDSRRRVDPARP